MYLLCLREKRQEEDPIDELQNLEPAPVPLALKADNSALYAAAAETEKAVRSLANGQF